MIPNELDRVVQYEYMACCWQRFVIQSLVLQADVGLPCDQNERSLK